MTGYIVIAWAMHSVVHTQIAAQRSHMERFFSRVPAGAG